MNAKTTAGNGRNVASEIAYLTRSRTQWSRGRRVVARQPVIGATGGSSSTPIAPYTYS